jgi:hypothetical protein
VEGIDLTVYYFTQHTLKGVDRQFGKEIEWDIPLLEGYKYQFLKNIRLNRQFQALFGD